VFPHSPTRKSRRSSSKSHRALSSSPRYLHSPLLARRGEIRNIREAIQILGEKGFRRWASIVAIVPMVADKPHELIRTALTRAYFCEEISTPIGMSASSSDLFLMGILSVTDALLEH
jgi:c-di-GMP phosphodiesterase